MKKKKTKLAKEQKLTETICILFRLSHSLCQTMSKPNGMTQHATKVYSELPFVFALKTEQGPNRAKGRMRLRRKISMNTLKK